MNGSSRFHISKRATIPWYLAWAIRLGAVVLAMIVCALVTTLLTGQNPLGVYATIIEGSFGTIRKFWVLLQEMAILLCVSLAVTPAFKMRFWNIGAEGQILVGAIASAACMIYLKNIPTVLLLVVMVIASLLAGGIWGLFPGLFKAKWNTNETLFTLMMNYVATFLVGYFLVIWVPSGSSSLGKLKYGKLPSFGNDYLLIILIVLALTAALYIYLNYTKQGYEINVVGESVRTARYIGINVNKVIIRTMILSGALCGLAGYLIGAGLDQTVTADSVGGQGFTGIMVAWLGKFNPLAMILTAGLIQVLNQGAAQISQDFDVSGAFPDVIVGIILFFVIGSEFFINYKIHFRGHHDHATGKEAVK